MNKETLKDYKKVDTLQWRVLGFRFVLRDFWVGVYVRTECSLSCYWYREKRTFYVCLLPCFPFIFARLKILSRE